MELITAKALVKNIADRWLAQYPKKHYIGTPKWEIYKKLVDLGDNAKPDEVCSIIGNDSWVRVDCDSCDKNVDQVIFIKGGYDNDFSICLDCLNIANGLVKSNNI